MRYLSSNAILNELLLQKFTFRPHANSNPLKTHFKAVIFYIKGSQKNNNVSFEYCRIPTSNFVASIFPFEHSFYDLLFHETC